MTDLTPSAVSSISLYGLSVKLAKRIAEWRNRRAMKRMLELEDHLLQDLGVRRTDVQSSVDLPLSIDAADALYRTSLQNKRTRT